MAKHITDQDIEKVVLLIDQWDAGVKFTWEKLCDLALNRYSIAATRQTLQGYSRIKSAYDDKKEDLRLNGTSREKVPPSLKIAARRIATLEAENRRLKKEQERLLAQFVVWQYNAYARGITMEQLNTPMAKKNR